MWIKEIPDYPASAAALGRSGQGKSTFLRKLEERFYGDDKVLDLTDWGRFELGPMAFPAKNDSMFRLFLSRLSKYTDDRKQWTKDILSDVEKMWEPKGYPVEIFVPATVDMPRRLPSLFRPFKLDFRSLGFEEMVLLLGGDLSEVAQSLLSLAWLEKEKRDEYGMKDLVQDVVDYASMGKVKLEGVEAKVGDMRSVAPLLRSISRVQRSGLLAEGGEDELTLDLNAIMRDTSMISGFSYAFIEDIEISYLLIAYILRRIHNLRLRDAEGYPQLRLFIREAHKVAPARLDFSGQDMSRKYMRLILSEPRDIGISTYMDLQRFKAMDLSCRVHPQTFFVFRTEKSTVDAINDLVGVPDSVAYLMINEDIGMYCLYSTAQGGWEAPMFYIPPESRIKEFDEGFMELWRKKKGGYTKWKIKKVQDPLTVEKVQPLPAGEGSDTKKPSVQVMKVNAIVAFLLGKPRGWLDGKEIWKAIPGLTKGYWSELGQRDYFKDRIERKRSGRHFLYRLRKKRPPIKWRDAVIG